MASLTGTVYLTGNRCLAHNRLQEESSCTSAPEQLAAFDRDGYLFFPAPLRPVPSENVRERHQD